MRMKSTRVIKNEQPVLPLSTIQQIIIQIHTFQQCLSYKATTKQIMKGKSISHLNTSHSQTLRLIIKLSNASFQRTYRS